MYTYMPGYNQPQAQPSTQPPEQGGARILRYAGRISRSGKRLYIVVPKRLHQELRAGQEVIIYLQPL